MASTEREHANKKARTVACPTCNAKPGELCTTPAYYQKVTWVHPARDDAYRAAAAAATGTKHQPIVWLTQGSLADLGEALSNSNADLHAPAAVLAIAELLRLAEWPELAQGLIETEQDAHPDEWAAHARWELAARTGQHDEDTKREEI